MLSGTLIISIISTVFLTGVVCIFISLFENDSQDHEFDKFMDSESYLEEFQEYLQTKRAQQLLVSPNPTDLV